MKRKHAFAACAHQFGADSEKFGAKALSLRLIPLLRVLRVHSTYARRTAKFEKHKRATFVFFQKNQTISG